MEDAPQLQDQKPVGRRRRELSYGTALLLMYWWVYCLFLRDLSEFTLDQTLSLYLPFIVVMVPWQLCERGHVIDRRRKDAAPDTQESIQELSLGWLFGRFFATAALMIICALLQDSYLRGTLKFYPGDPEGMWPAGLFPFMLLYAVIFTLGGIARAALRKLRG